MSKRVSGIFIIVAGLTAGLIYLGCGGSSSGGDGDGPRLAFTTSVTGNGNLSTWADADGNAGLDAADAVCQARADAAGLSGTFVAWMSDSINDAYCRVHGLSGKVDTVECGQVSLPADAGPWVRTDGFAFDATISQLTMGVIYSPLRFDEFGSSVPASSYVFTATDLDGTLRTDSCSDWSSSTSGTFGTSGLTETTGSWWTSSGATDCSDDIAIMCMETGPGEALPAYASSGQVVFVSSVGGHGDLYVWPQAGGQTGVAAGDAVCRNLANSAGYAITANFKAWLSDSVNSAVSRLTGGGPWVRPDGVKIADDNTDLIDGNLFAPINVMDTGQYDTGNGVWTGTLETGAMAASMCSDWADTTAQSTFGSAVYADGNWTDLSQLVCSGGSYRIYCFEGP
jgi:hypothetical protein